MGRSTTRRSRCSLWRVALAAALPVVLACRGAAESAPVNAKVPRGVLVAHALGSIDGVAYTNSLEALRCNHARGFRWFEVDLTLTLDQQLVAFHTQHEKHASLPRPIDQLPYSDVQRARYRGRFSIPLFADVLREAQSLGGVVLVTDTKRWSPEMLGAVRRALAAAPEGGSAPRIVFQSYGEKDIEDVARLAKEVGAGLILTLYQTRAVDQQVLEMAQKHDAIAVVANSRRFTPWLAGQLHAAHIPIVVHTVNDHEQVVELTRAGADGFYTDTYVPYQTMAADPRSLLACGATEASPRDLRPWLERSLSNPTDFRLSSCAVQRAGHVLELSGCDSKPAISGPNLAVPPGGKVHVELEAEAPSAGAELSFQVLWKDGSKAEKPQRISLAPGERRTVTRDAVLTAGSSGVETLLRMSSSDSRLSVRRLTVALNAGPTASSAPTSSPSSSPATPGDDGG
jgi:glycerophosphoryl diester phosphodiesterase